MYRMKRYDQLNMMSSIRYIIALLMIIKIFQFRHPDLTANAYKVTLKVSKKSQKSFPKQYDQTPKILFVRSFHLLH